PCGISARPRRASNTVMLVIQTDSAGWRSNHATTTASGTVRIIAEITLVSRIIIYRTLPTAESDRAIPAGPWSALLSRNEPQYVTPVWLHVYFVLSPRRVKCAGPPLPCCACDAQHGV